MRNPSHSSDNELPCQKYDEHSEADCVNDASGVVKFILHVHAAILRRKSRSARIPTTLIWRKIQSMKKSSEDKIGVVDLRRANLVRRFGLKITPAVREYYRYTGISAEVERHGFGHSNDSRFQSPLPIDAPEHHTHGN